MANENKGKSLFKLNIGEDGRVSFEDNFKKAVEDKMAEAYAERNSQATGKQPGDNFEYVRTDGNDNENENDNLTPEWQKEQKPAEPAIQVPLRPDNDGTSDIERMKERIKEMTPWVKDDAIRIMAEDMDGDVSRLSGAIANRAIEKAQAEANQAYEAGTENESEMREALARAGAPALAVAGAGIEQGVETSRAYWKNLTPEAVNKRIEESLNAISYLDIDAAAKKAGVDTDWYMNNVIAPQLQKSIYNKLLEKHVPQSTLEYVASGAFNSIIGQIAETIYYPTEIRQLRAQGRQIAGEREGTVAEMGNMAVGFLADAPIFKGIGGLVGKLRYAGPNKALGMAIEFAKGGANFGGYNAVSTLTGAAHQKGEIAGEDVLEAGKAFGRGMVTGTAMGAVGALGQTGIAKWSQRNGIGLGTRIGTKAAHLTSNTATMAVSDMLLSPDTDVTSGRDWADQFKHSLMMNLVMDTQHMIVSAISKPAIPYKQRGVDIQAMKDAGLPVRSEKELYRWLTQPGQTRNRLENDILSNPKLSLEEKNKALQLVAGDKASLQLRPTVDAVVTRTMDGRWVVKESDALETVNRRRVFATKEEAEAYRESLQPEIMRNQTDYVEQMDNARNETVAMQEGIKVVAQESGKEVSKIKAIILKNGNGEKLTKEEEALRDQVFSYRDAYRDYATTTREEALEAVEVANGMEAGSMEAVLQKDYKNLNDAERKAVQDYNSLMRERLSGKGQAEGVTGAREDLFTPEMREQSRARGQQLYAEGTPEQRRHQRLVAEDAGKRLASVFGEKFVNTLDEQGLRFVESLNEQGIEFTAREEELITDYLAQKETLESMLGEMDGAHKVEADVARQTVKGMSPMTDESGNTVVRVVGERNGKTYVVRSQTGDSMMLTPVELREDGTIDWNSYDGDNIVGKDWKPGMQFREVLGSDAMKALMPDYMQEYNAIFGEPEPQAGMEVTMPGENNKPIRVKLMGRDAAGNWIGSGELGEITLADTDVRRMVSEQEKAAVEVENGGPTPAPSLVLRGGGESEEETHPQTSLTPSPSPGRGENGTAVEQWSRDGYKIKDGQEVRADVEETAKKMVEDAEGDAGLALRAVRNKQNRLRSEMEKIRKEYEKETETKKLLEQKRQYDSLNDELEYWNRVEAYDSYKAEAEKEPALITRQRAMLMRQMAEKTGSRLNVSDNMYATMRYLAATAKNNKAFLHVTKEDAARINGFNFDGTIYINGESVRGLLWSFGHESGHSVAAASKEGFKAYKEAVRAAMGEDAWEQAKEAKRKIDVYKDATKEALEEEVVSDSIGEIFNDPNKFDTFAKLLVDGRVITGLKALWDATKKFADNMSMEGLQDVAADLKKEWETVSYSFEGAEKKLYDAYRKTSEAADKTSGNSVRHGVRWSVELNDKEKEEGKPYYDMVTDLFENHGDKAKYENKNFYLCDTPEQLKVLGLQGSKFTINYKAIKTHQGKDADHDLDASAWKALPSAMKNPIVVTQYSDDQSRFRLYTNIIHNGNVVVVGVDVKKINQGKNKPILEINSVKTAFGRSGGIGTNEKVIAYNKEITPEQEAILNEPNLRTYPTIQELFRSKGTENISNGQENGGKFSIEPEQALEIGKGAEWRWKQLHKGKLNKRNINWFLYGMSHRFPKLGHSEYNNSSSGAVTKEVNGVSVIDTEKAGNRAQEIWDMHAYRDELLDLYTSDVTTPRAKAEVKSKIIDYDYSLNFYRKLASGELTASDVWGLDFPKFSKEEPNEGDNHPVFYSNAQRAVEGIKQEKATPEQWLAMIQKLGGIKSGEDKWMGLSDWLKSQDKKSLTRDEVMKYIQENQIQVEEVKYAEDGMSDPTQKYEEEFRSWIDVAPDDIVEAGEEEAWAWERMIEQYGEDFGKAFDYDGDNIFTRSDETGDNYLYPELVKEFWGDREINNTRLKFTTRGLKNNKEIALTVPTIESWNERDAIHFGDAGEGRAIGWVRFGETEITEPNTNIEEAYKKAADEYMGYRKELRDKYGVEEWKKKRTQEEHDKIYELWNNLNKANEARLNDKGITKARVLVIDEVQSKRHQEGREKGYGNGAVPDAPFDKNWQELCMKRMLRYAAENGYDKLAWTTGAQQAERYDIGKVIDQVERNQTFGDTGETRFDLQPKDNSGGISLFVKDGIVTRSSMEDFEGKPLTDVVGKDLAAKMLEMKDYSSMNITDMQIGGEGMVGFYDRMLPSFMNKYGKKWGVKVEDVNLPKLDGGNGLTMHSVDVTPEMKESVLIEGQPMFSKEGEKGQRRLVEAGMDEDNLEVAKAMREAGKDALAIKMATGWEYGHDGKWKKEDEDLHFQEGVFEKYQPLVNDMRTFIYKPLPEVMGDSRLFKAYPKLKDILLNVNYEWPAKLHAGYEADMGYLSLNKRLFEGKADVAKRRVEEVIAHEVQHIIQDEEGFARGGNTELLNRKIVEDNMTPEEKEAHNKAIHTQKQSADTLESLREQSESLKEMSFDKSGYRTIQEFLDTKEAKWQPAVKMMNDLKEEYKTTREEFDRATKEAYDIRENVRKRLGLSGMFLGLDGYHRLAGEVEARSVMNRINMKPENRRKVLTEVDEDVPAAEQILRFSKEVIDANDKFNNELEKQIRGDLEENHVYQLGSPSAILMSTGIPNYPIQLSASRLKAKSDSYGHDFELKEIKDLVKLIQTPLAIFAYGNPEKAQNLIIEIQKGNNNFVVGMAINPEVKGKYLEIISIRNVFPKKNAEWLNWISQGKMLYGDKERIQNLIDQQRTVLADVDYLDLDSVAKVLKNFENPKTIEEKVSENSDSPKEASGKQKDGKKPSADAEGVPGTVQGLDGYTEQEVLDIVRGDVQEIFDEAGIDAEIKGMALNGSRMRGDAKADSDLDVVIEYTGDYKEDALYNLLNESPIMIEGVRVDINPITKYKSGTLEQYMERSRKYDEEVRGAKFSKEERSSFNETYNQFKGKAKDAVEFLLSKGRGRAVGALHHNDVGDIDLWYGTDKAGLKKIINKHPEVIDNLQDIIDGLGVESSSENRIVLSNSTHKAVISKMLGKEKTDNWLLSAYMRKGTSASSSDIETEPNGKQNGTAPLQNSLSENKGTENISNGQEKDVKFSKEVPTKPKEGEHFLDYAERVMAEERTGVDTNPTEAQKEAGNYRKGHIRLDGYNITIENPKGSTRSGKDADGKEWSVKMNYDYGYIRGTKGVDGDHIDVYLGPDQENGHVFVVDQIDQKSGKFDEHKVMYGFPDAEAATKAYLSQYEDGWKVGPVTEVTKEEFKKWVDSSTRKTKPFSEYASVKPMPTASEERRVKSEESKLPEQAADVNNGGNVLRIGDNTVSLQAEDADYVRRQKESLPKSDAWRSDFPQATILTSKVQSRFPDLYNAAKSGDRESAFELINKLSESKSVADKISKLVEDYPDAIVAYPQAVEAGGRNKIPMLWADKLASEGLKIADDIYVTNKPKHTGSSDESRLVRRARFAGDVEKGGKYILLDDQVSSGATLRDMKDYIESQGGEVVQIVGMTASMGGHKIAPSEEHINRLQELGVTDKQLQDYGIAESIRHLTDGEAAKLIRLVNRRGDTGYAKGVQGGLSLGKDEVRGAESQPRAGEHWLDYANRVAAEDRLAVDTNPTDAEDKIKFSKEDTHTENFKRFFGDWQKDPENASKVVDAEGRPLVVYHGTGSYGFNVFKENKEWSYDTDRVEGTGIFFTSDKQNAIGYEDAELAEETGNKNPKEGVYSVYLNIRNPFIIDYQGAWWNGRKFTYEVLDEKGKVVRTFLDWNDAKVFAEEYGKEHGYVPSIKDVQVHSGLKRTSQYVTEAKQKGYDGVIFKNIRDSHLDNHVVKPATSYAVFEPTQIKSATENNGEYDPKNPDIRFSKEIDVPTDEYAKIAHTIATYPKKIERGHVFTENNYYLCTDIDKEGGFKVIAALPIEGNEDYINEIRRDEKENIVPVKPTESTLRIVKDAESRGGRTGWDYAGAEGLRERAGGDASLSMGQQADTGRDRQETGGDGGEPIIKFSKEGKSAEWKKAKEELKDYPFAQDILHNLEQQDIYDVAASVLAGGNLLWGDKGEGPNRKKGVASMMGWKEGERKNFLSMFARNGMSFAQAGEAVEQACRDAHIRFDENDPMAGVNALQDVLGSARNMSDLNSYVEQKRVQEAYDMVREEQERMHEDRNDYYRRAYGMSYDEYMTYQEESAKAQAGGGVSEEAQRTIDWLRKRNERQQTELSRIQTEIQRVKEAELARPLVVAQGKIIEQQQAQLTQTKTELNELKDATKRKKSYEDAYRQLLAVKHDVTEFVKGQLAAEDMPFTSKRELNKLLATIEKTNTAEQLEDALREVRTVVGHSRVKHLEYELSKLLRMKIQGLNGKNMSVAKTVDDRTRRIIEDIRGRVQDIGISGMEEELDGLMRARREQRAAINELRTKLAEADEAEKLSVQRQIDEGENRWKELSEQIQTKADEISEARENKRGRSMEDLTEEINAIMEQADKLAEDGKQLPETEADKLTALEGFKILQQSKKSANDVYKLDKEIRDLWKEIYDLRVERDGVQDENERKRLNRLILNRKEKIKANESLLADALEQQAFDIQEGINMLETLMDEGRNSLKQKVDAALLRRSEMIRNACADVRNKKNEVNYNRGEKDVKRNPTWKMFVNAPIGSFEYLAQRLGQTGKAGKDSWIYQHFVMGKEGIMEAFNTYQRGLREQKDQLNAKVTEIFGTENSKLVHTDAWVRQAGKADKIVYDSGVTIRREDGKREVLPLSKGAATYLYMVWKMEDGKSKMLLQGFDNTSMQEIRDFIGKDYIQLADWLQDTFLVGTRAKYNGRYRELYNTSMARIENYVPLRVNKDATRQETALSEDKNRKMTLEQRAGSLINRTVNNLPVDITKSVFDVIGEHVEQMENWYAYSPVRRDLDAILSNTFFRNQVDANNAGHFKRFYDAAAIATQSYVPPAAEHGDALMAMMTKGLLGGNIAWRAATAIKQLYSASAYLGYTYDPIFVPYLIKNVATGALGMNMKWCINNIPSFRARVDLGDIGNVRISEKVGDVSGNLAKRINKYLQNYTAFGMIPNRVIDALTCSIGAKSIYDYKLRELRLEIEKDRTLTPEQRVEALKEAHRKAVMEADIFYNSTQQSSNPMFLSPMQVSRTLVDRSMTAYQNNNLGYVRKTLEAAYDLLQSAQYKKMKEAYKQSYMEDGIAEDEAAVMARRQVLKTAGKGLLGLVVMGWLNKYLWDTGSTGFFGFWSDPVTNSSEQGEDESDEDYKNRMEWQSFYDWIGVPARPLQGTPMGNYLVSVSEKRSWNPLLVFNEIDDLREDMEHLMKNDGVFSKELLWTVTNHAMRTGGVNLETLGNIYYGLEQMAIDGGGWREKMVDLMFALNNPNKGRMDAARNLYKNEDFITYAQDVAKADKYLTKGTALAHFFPWMKEYNGDGANGKELKREYDRLKKEWESYNDIDFSKPADVGAETTKIYNDAVKWDDIVQDDEIANLSREVEGVNREWNRLKGEDNKSDYPSTYANDYLKINGKEIAQFKLINKYKKKFGALKRKLNGTTQDETVMNDIRKLRAKFLKKIKDEEFLQQYVEEELE